VGNYFNLIPIQENFVINVGKKINMTEKEKNRRKVVIVIAGTMKWNEFRDKLIQNLKGCDTEEKFCDLMEALEYSFSHSEEEMQKKRRKLGIPET